MATTTRTLLLHHHHHLHFHFLQPPPLSFPSTPRLRYFHHRRSPLNSKSVPSIKQRFVTQCLAVAESSSSSSDSPKSISPSFQSLLQDLADRLDLPGDYFAKLPRDLRLDLNDAAFDLSSGAVIDECGQDLGQILLNLSRAWESADTSTSHSLALRLPSLASSLADNERSGKRGKRFDALFVSFISECVFFFPAFLDLAFGQRLMSAGARFQSMGAYGQGELQKISETMINAGQTLCGSSLSAAPEQLPETETRMFKFGELQVAVTPDKANAGAVIGVVFGILSWVVSQGIQSVPESSLQYANDNALLLAKSLRGALLAMFYAATFLSGLSSVGLVLLARDLKSKEK